jgi:hypothetical protein
VRVGPFGERIQVPWYGKVVDALKDFNLLGHVAYAGVSSLEGKAGKIGQSVMQA